jgi:hypothetical protein
MEEIPYSVRLSTRAKRVTLRILPGKGLEVVVPRGFDSARVPELVRSNRAWIEKHLSRTGSDGRHPGDPAPLPGRIRLAAINADFRVVYEPGAEGAISLREPDSGDLVLRGGDPGAAPGACAQLLREWVKKQGRKHLLPWLEQVAVSHGFKYSRAEVRCQRTRWGSCSRKNNISLNCKLLFLPARLARHVLLHELCHTLHHDHSRSFWDLVSRTAPDYALCERELKRAWRHVPEWIR